MAATQVGTGSLTITDPQTAAATYITIPSGAIVESVTIDPGANTQMDTQYDSLGAFHTDIWYEKRQHEATIVLVGKPYGKSDVGQTDVAAYEIVGLTVDDTSKPVRTTIRVKKIVFT
jgi:hypothetical protein